MFTAKVVCTKKTETGEGDSRSASVQFNADYADGRNQEWAIYTPSLSLGMTLNGTAADLVEEGKAYTLKFEEDTPARVDAEG